MSVIARALLACGWAAMLASCGDDDTATGPNSSAQEEQITWSFASKSLVSLAVVSGEASVDVGAEDSIRVTVVHAYVPAGAFEARYETSADRLALREELEGATSGYSRWTVTVPPQTAVELTSASGDLDVDGVQGGIRVTTASGEVRIRNASGAIAATTASGGIRGDNLNGDLELVSASGGIEIDGATGVCQISTASGDIEVEDITLTDASAFSSASGTVRVKLAASPESDLSVSSASGNAIVNYDGNEVAGYFEFTAREDQGRIVSPVAFESEEQFQQSGVTYDRKSFTQGADQPRVTINTASGKAELRD